MLDIGWPELVVIGAVALVAIGPKDLPKVMHAMGRWAGKARRFGQDLQHYIEQVGYEADIAEKVKHQDKAATSAPPPADKPHD
jgi:sec-independent protein translocase protein TatB